MIEVYILTVVFASAAPGVTVAPTVDVNLTTTTLDVVTTKSPVNTTSGDVDTTESETSAVIETTTPGGWSNGLILQVGGLMASHTRWVV